METTLETTGQGLLETMEAFAARTVEAREKRSFQLPGDHPRRVFVRTGEIGTPYVPEYVSGPALGILCVNPTNMVDALSDWLTNHETEGTTAPTAVFVSAGGIVAVVNMDDRRDRLRVPLSPTAAWASLRAELGEKRLKQKEFIEALRKCFGENDAPEVDGLGVDPSLIASLRNLRFDKSTNGESKVVTGKESLSASTIAKMQTGEGAAELPDYFVIRVKLWHECSQTVAVKAYLRIDPSECQFSFYVGSDILRALETAALMSIKSDIMERLKTNSRASIPVYLGTVAE